MTPRQKFLLDFISKYVDEHGLSPSYREMAHAMGSTHPSHAFATVERLLRAGDLIKVGRPCEARTLRLGPSHQNQVGGNMAGL